MPYETIIVYSHFQNKRNLKRMEHTPSVSLLFTATNPAYLKLPYDKRPDSGPITISACGRAAQCTAQE